MPMIKQISNADLNALLNDFNTNIQPRKNIQIISIVVAGLIYSLIYCEQE